MSRTDIANYLRLAPETVSRVLRRFQDEGLVVVERRELEIRDEPRLHALARSVLRDYREPRAGPTAGLTRVNTGRARRIMGRNTGSTHWIGYAGKVCIVTGASKGIGRACALRLAQEGAQIALSTPTRPKRPALLRELGPGRDGKAHRFWRVDVSSEAEVKAAIDAVVAHFGALHVLVNNAGIAGANKPTHELTEAEWDRVQAVNVKGPFFCTKHAIAHLRRAGGGSIVNLSSIYGLVGAPDLPPTMRRRAR